MIPSTFFFSARAFSTKRGPGPLATIHHLSPFHSAARANLAPGHSNFWAVPNLSSTPSSSRRSAATSSQVLTVTVRLKPFDCLFERPPRGAGRISQIARRLVVPHPHLFARHANSIERRHRLAPRHRRPTRGGDSRRVSHRVRNPQFGRYFSGHLRQ